jgi:TatD DNase family protein
MSYINIHSHKQQDADITVCNIDICNSNVPAYNGIYSVGAHPWFITQDKTEDIKAKLNSSVSDKSVVFIGECGLDKLCDTEFELQKEIFQYQIELSVKHNKPLIIHCVKAYNEIIRMLKEADYKLPWIIHGFARNLNIAKDVINAGGYLSFGVSLLKNENLQRVLRQIPDGKFLFETDDDEAIPVKEIYKIAAQERDCNIETLKSDIYKLYTFLTTNELR